MNGFSFFCQHNHHHDENDINFFLDINLRLINSFGGVNNSDIFTSFKSDEIIFFFFEVILF